METSRATSLVFNLDPVAKGRPRHDRKGHVYTPEKTREFENAIALLARAQYKGEPLDGPLWVRINATFKRPKTVKREWHTVKPDSDNIAKSILDPLNGIIYKDDSQIVNLQIFKAYGDAGKIEVWIRDERYFNYHV